MHTMPEDEICCKPEPFGTIIKRLVVSQINAVDDPLEREDRIQIALDCGILTYAESYQLRTDGEL